MAYINKKVCFILFSRKKDRNSRRLKKIVSTYCDFFLLSYDENKIKINDPELLVYSRKDIEKHFQNAYPKYSVENWKIMPGNLDLCQLSFIKNNPGYDKYWFCEDDVRYTGNMAHLLRELDEVDYDLLATNIRKPPDGWFHTSSFKTPVERNNELTSAFLPFFRISKRASEAIICAYHKGWSGHHEITWPEIVKSCSYSMEDIGVIKPMIYTSNILSARSSPGTFIYRPSRFLVPKSKNVLYHPVKPWGIYIKERIRRLIYKY